MKKVLIACAVALFTSAFAASDVPRLQRLANLFPGFANVDINAVAPIPTQSAIVFIGDITPYQAQEFKRHLAAMPDARTLYIDSGGGDIASAIAIANDVRDHDMRVIVAGRCVSACANYIFAGARTKIVMPGSLVGIHATTYTYLHENAVTTTGRLDKHLAAALKTDATLRKNIEDVERQERLFYARIGLSHAYHDAYDAYEAARARSKEPESAACPRLRMWILTRSQFESMGVKGIQHFWEPRSRADVSAAAASLDMPPDQIFYGSAADLGKLCQPSLLQRIRALF